MTIRAGAMDVRVNGDDPTHELQKIARAVNAELGKSGERLVRLLGEHWTGYAEGPVSPYVLYQNVGYEAEPTI